MKEILPKLFATLVYHKVNGNLKKLLPRNHPIFQQPIFSQTRFPMDVLYQHIDLGINDCAKCNMRGTGISPFVTVLVAMEKIFKFNEKVYSSIGK